MTPDYEIIIVGSGPAGLAAAQYGARANLKTLAIEAMAPGGALLLISDLENYPGFPSPVNGFDLSDSLRKQAETFGASFKTASVSSINKDGNLFIVETDSGKVSAWAVIVATGTKHKHLGIQGEEEFSGHGVSYCATCDGPFFKNQRILVVGGGDAACDEAVYLANLSDKITLIHRRDRFRAQKSLAERVHKNPRIEVRLNHILKRIEGNQKVESVILERTDTGELYEEAMDAVFVFIGAIPQTQLVPNLEKDSAGYIITDFNMQTEIKGLFVAGDVRSTPFRQVVVACGEGAIAAHRASMHIDEIKGEAYKGLNST